MLFKYYRRDGAETLYREGWDTDSAIVEHWGICGTRGDMRRHSFADSADRLRIFSDLIDAARLQGYQPVPAGKHEGLLVQKSVEGMGTAEDVERRHALEAWLNEQLGWTGLGHCDGGSIGSGSMEAFCLVIDYELAEETLREMLAKSAFADFAIRRDPLTGD